MKKKLLMSLLFILVFSNTVFAEPEWKDNVDWEWNGYGKCMKAECLSFFIDGDIIGLLTGRSTKIPVFRGEASPHDCVENAVKAERNGEHNIAIRWLQAGQAHNEGAQRVIAEAREAVLAYIITQYGKDVKN